MRTGLLDEAPSEAIQEQNVELIKKLMALTLSLVTKSGENAAVYATHAGRPQVLAADVNRGLMYQSKIFMSCVTDDEVSESYDAVDDAMNDESESDTSSSGWEDELEEEEKKVEWTRSSCTCDVCTGMNDAAETWESYDPEDDLLKYLKARTDEIISKST